MASLLLLTPEKAQRNKALFEVAPAKHVSPGAAPPSPSLFSVSSEDTASALAVSNASVKSGSLPPPFATIFSDPAYHENVISTFFTTAMTAVNYVPNSPTQSPQEQAISFTNFLSELVNYGYYFPLEYSKSDKYEPSSSDYAPLLKSISEFITSVESIMGAKNAQEVATGATNMIKSAIESIGSSSSENVEKTLYSVYHVNGDVVNKPYPVGTVFWSSVGMERHISGKSTVQKQSVELYSYSYTVSYIYMILSPVVVANAQALATATPIGVSAFVDAINKNTPIGVSAFVDAINKNVP